MNGVIYNTVLDACVACQDIEAAKEWINAHSDERSVAKTMDLIGTMKESTDEVLLSSLVEAGMRVGKPDLHSADPAGLVQDCITGSHTFGSLIKAYGFSQDIDGVGQCWKDISSRSVQLSESHGPAPRGRTLQGFAPHAAWPGLPPSCCR